MIYAFTGKTGSGKTYSMVSQAYLFWKSGVDIYSNTVLFFDKFKPSFLEKITSRILGEPIKRGRITYFEDINEILEIHNGLILFDEAQVLFNARQWESLPAEFQYKLQQHRKHQLDLFCTTQNLGTIDITYRRLIQKWTHCQDVFALFGKRNPSFLTVHRAQEKDIDMIFNSVDDMAVPVVDAHFFTIHRWKRRLYDTFYDIGFKRFKTIWLSSFDPAINKTTSKAFIIPKQLSLADAQKRISSYQSALNLSKSNHLKRN